jgi:hypothetical protein
MRELQEKVEDLDIENRRVKVRLQELQEMCYPLRAAVAKITQKASPQFSPDCMSPIKARKKSHQY